VGGPVERHGRAAPGRGFATEQCRGHDEGETVGEPDRGEQRNRGDRSDGREDDRREHEATREQRDREKGAERDTGEPTGGKQVARYQAEAADGVADADLLGGEVVPVAEEGRDVGEDRGEAGAGEQGGANDADRWAVPEQRPVRGEHAGKPAPGGGRPRSGGEVTRRDQREHGEGPEREEPCPPAGVGREDGEHRDAQDRRARGRDLDPADGVAG
jgi:hypothetical protein